MTRKTMRESADYFSSQLSNNVKQLAFAGIALIWVFHKVTKPDEIAVPQGLLWAGCLFVAALFFDFLQYLYGSLAWYLYHKRKVHQGLDDKQEFMVPSAINFPTNTCFVLKAASVGIGYLLVLRFLVGRITL